MSFWLSLVIALAATVYEGGVALHWDTADESLRWVATRTFVATMALVWAFIVWLYFRSVQRERVRRWNVHRALRRPGADI